MTDGRASNAGPGTKSTGRSTTWRGLDEADRAKPPLVLLAEHPALMKRPLITNGDEMYLGWDKTTQAALGVG